MPAESGGLSAYPPPTPTTLVSHPDDATVDRGPK